MAESERPARAERPPGLELQRIPPQPPRSQPGAGDVLAGLARLAAGAWLRTAGWGLGVTLRVLRAAGDPQELGELTSDVADGIRGYARQFLGVADLEERIRQMIPGSAVVRPSREYDDDGTAPIELLRRQAADLLRQSAAMDLQDGAHPAYARILEELAPDEARMLRLLATEGAQPAIDVRAVQLIGLGSSTVAEGMNMIGQEAGCSYPERVPSYLSNLHRLGLIWFSKEPIDDPVRYQVLEAQPEVLGAIKETSRARSVQRSIRLTPFGRDFCQACLPLDSSPASSG
jgi:hypothetical protein